MRKLLVVLLLLCSSPLFSQVRTFGALETNNTWIGTQMWGITAPKQVASGPEMVSFTAPGVTRRVAIWAGQSGDTEAKFLLDNQGFVEWGVGGVTDQDSSLSRNVGGFMHLISPSGLVTGTAAAQKFHVTHTSTTNIVSINRDFGAGTGTLDVKSFNSSFPAIRASTIAAANTAFAAFQEGDAQLRFEISGAGQQTWGSGAGTFDVAFYRPAVAALAMVGNPTVANISVGIGGIPDADTALHIKASQATQLKVDVPLPSIFLRENDQAVDERLWQTFINGKVWVFRVTNDAVTTEGQILLVRRGVGNAITNVEFPNGNFGVGVTPDTKFHVQGDGKFKNAADATLSLFLDSGNTAGQNAQLVYRDRGIDLWALYKTTGNNFIISDVGVADRITFTRAGATEYRSGSTTSHHDFKDSAGTMRIRIVGNADKIGFGSLADTAVSRGAAGRLFAEFGLFVGTAFADPGLNNLRVEGGIGIQTTPDADTALHLKGSQATQLKLDATAPSMFLRESDQAIDERLWQTVADAKVWTFRTTNDAITVAGNILLVRRGTGTTITNVEFPNGNFGVGVTPDTKFHVQGDGKFKNSSDAVLTVIFDSGNTAAQLADLRFRDRGSESWLIRKDTANNLIIQDVPVGANRVVFSTGAGTQYRTGSDSTHHDFQNASGVVRIRIHGDADKISLGSAVDTTVERNAAGIVQVSGLLTNNSVKQGSGLKHQRVTTGSCATTGCSVTLTWTAAFADATYTANCDIEDSNAVSETTGLRKGPITSKTASAVVVWIDNLSGSAITGTLACNAKRD